MGPPISTWPYSHPPAPLVNKDASENIDRVKCFNFNKSLLFHIIHGRRAMCLNFTVALVLIQLLACLNAVRAGPVVLSLDYLQGPTPIARNIRHLPCISRKTGQEGLCMFAIDCLKANGTHLGTCIDRFYFGSCCQLADKTILPQIIGNNIEDNSIDSANFVHPQTEDKIESTVTKIPDRIFPTRKVTIRRPTTTLSTTTESLTTPTITEKSETVIDHTESLPSETKSDEHHILDNKIPNENVKITTLALVETTTENKVTIISSNISAITELPVKLSTFQTVSANINNVTTIKPIVTTKAPKPSSISSTLSTQNVVSITPKPNPKPSRRPTKPTYRPRPQYKPINFTRPSNQSNKPKPISTYNFTRLPYRPPPKRPSTKIPLPSPPRLNITVIPQSTSSKPIFHRPSSSSITYISTTVSSIKPETSAPSTILSTTSTTLPSSTITTASTSTTTTSTTTAPTTITEKITETTELIAETSTTFEPTKRPTLTTVTLESITDKSPEPTTVELTPEISSTESVAPTTIEETVKETLKPTSVAGIPSSSSSSSISTTVTESSTATSAASSTEFPTLVTWSSTVDTSSKTPDKVTSVSDEMWSPITPPEGWVLISTIPPNPNTTKLTTTTTTTTTEAPTTSTQSKIETTGFAEQPASIPDTTTKPNFNEPPNTTTNILNSTALPNSTDKSTSVSSTEAGLIEFTVNVTLSPTMPTSTSSMGLTTFTSVTSENVTESVTLITNYTEAPVMHNVTESSSTESGETTVPDKVEYDMENYKDVCGRRLWPQSRIVGGNKSEFGKWPWQISLRQYRTSTYLHKCGAALLNENWAITAAHCVEHVPPSELLIRLGEHDLANENEPFGFAERRVQLVASHPHFDPATFEYDLALLRFLEPVKFQPNILPVCIPDNEDNYVGKTAYVTGWGRLYDEGPLPSVLQEVAVPVINNSACEGMYKDAGYNEHIPYIFICAGWRKGGSDSCEGDSGGPMVVQRERDGRFVLSGIISWGIGCAEPNQPGVYTRISEFRDWINQILQF